MKKTLFSLLVVLMLLAFLVPVAVAKPVPQSDGGVLPTGYYLCSVTSVTTAYQKTTAPCNFTMLAYGWPATVGTPVAQSTTTVCGVSWRKITGGTWAGKYVYTVTTACVWHD